MLVVEDVVDHTNVGAVFRSAAGLGVDAILVTPRCADPLYRRSVRVSMGHVLTLPFAVLPDWPGDLARLHDAGYLTVALTPAADAVDLGEARLYGVEVAQAAIQKSGQLLLTKR